MSRQYGFNPIEENGKDEEDLLSLSLESPKNSSKRFFRASKRENQDSNTQTQTSRTPSENNLNNTRAFSKNFSKAKFSSPPPSAQKKKYTSPSQNKSIKLILPFI